MSKYEKFLSLHWQVGHLSLSLWVAAPDEHFFYNSILQSIAGPVFPDCHSYFYFKHLSLPGVDKEVSDLVVRPYA